MTDKPLPGLALFEPSIIEPQPLPTQGFYVFVSGQPSSYPDNGIIFQWVEDITKTGDIDFRLDSHYGLSLVDIAAIKYLSEGVVELSPMSASSVTLKIPAGYNLIVEQRSSTIGIAIDPNMVDRVLLKTVNESQVVNYVHLTTVNTTREADAWEVSFYEDGICTATKGWTAWERVKSDAELSDLREYISWGKRYRLRPVYFGEPVGYVPPVETESKDD